MSSIELFLRPPKHKWEAPAAYVFRIASLNHIRYKRLASTALLDCTLAGERLFDDRNENTNACPDRKAIRLSMAEPASRPRRLVCPLCISKGRPDILDQERFPYLEYCLFHGCRPVDKCPNCHVTLRYGSGSYGRCKCGFKLARATTTFAAAEVRRLYLAVAANIPVEMEPLLRELERHDLYDLHARLRSTWHLLWEDQPGRELSNGAVDVSPDWPAFGTRWAAASAILGIAEHRLGRWVTHIGCWWRHGRYKNHFASGEITLPDNLVAWRYMRVLIEQAVKSGCSGPTAGACIGAGYQCKTRRSGRRGDRLPTPFRSLIGPCMRPFVREVPRTLSSSDRRATCRDGAPQSLHELAALAPDGARKIIELVAIGALQPLEMSHPLQWQFARGEVEDFLRSAFRKYLHRDSEKNEGTLVRPYRPQALLLSPKMSMGMLFSGLHSGQVKPPAELPKNIWKTRFVKTKGMTLNACAQRSLHVAVVDSLSICASEAAVIAQSFLGLTADLHPNELELFCGPPPIPLQILMSFSPDTPLDFCEEPNPKNLAWRDGILEGDVSAKLNLNTNVSPQLVLYVRAMRKAFMSRFEPNFFKKCCHQEFADRMGCIPSAVDQLEVEGVLFSVQQQGDVDGKRYPMFQLDSRLDSALLKMVIAMYRDAHVSGSMLWSFLRRGQKEFGGKTAAEMLLGASAPAYEGLSPKDRKCAILDVVAEELSRTR